MVRRSVEAGPFFSFTEVAKRILMAGIAMLLTTPRASGAVGSLRVTGFEENRGQMDARVAYVAQAGGIGLFLTATEMVWTFGSPASLRMRLAGARLRGPIGVDPLPGTTQYMIGSSPERWHAGVRSFATVEYREIYRGVNLVFHNRADDLEYDFVVSHHGDANAIAIDFEGAEALRITPKGDLIVTVGGRDVVHRRPVAFQPSSGGRKHVEARYVRRGSNCIGFAVGPYDKAAPLIIDPLVVTSTYLGGDRADSGNAMAVDSAGNVYVAGESESVDFPVTSGVVQNRNRGSSNAFVAKFDPTGRRALFVTYLGGTATDVANAIAVDAAGNVYVAGETTSGDFPTTAGASQTALRGPSDAFVVKLSTTGTALLYGSYLGGNGFDRANAVAVDAGGSAFVTGRTDSTDTLATPGAFQSSFRGLDYDAFVAKMNPSGSALLYATYLGGQDNDAGFGIAVDSSGSAYVVGGTRSADFPRTSSGFQTSNLSTDGFFTRLNPSGTGIQYSTLLGGSFVDRANAVAVDSSGVARVAGWTSSSDFPLAGGTQPYGGGLFDAFVAYIDPSQSGNRSLLFSTFFGGSNDDRALGIAIGADGSTTITGSTSSTGLPVVAASQTNYGGGGTDAFVARFGPTRVVEYASWLGGSGDESGTATASGSGSEIWVTGRTNSINFPTANAIQPALAGGNDVFLTRISPSVQSSAVPVPTLSFSWLLLLAALLGGAAVVTLQR